MPPQQQLLFIYGGLYGLVTILVVLLLWRVLRRRRQQCGSVADQSSGTTSARPPADIATDDAQSAITEPCIAEPVSPLAKMKAGLAKTQSALLGKIDNLFSSSTVDDDFLDELEEILFTADFGVKTTQLLLTAFKRRVAAEKVVGAAALRLVLQEEILRLLPSDVEPMALDHDGPGVLLIIGVNGVGKTTTIGKLAQQFTHQGKKVILGAADTFRAAAAEQLCIWGERTGVTVVSHEEGSDPAAVAFDAAKAAVARNADIMILDTAGRLHTKVNLMEEMKKIHRVLGREITDAPHEILLVLDATTGQNALVQARLFQEAVGVTGVVITKLDGTAKGGMAVAIGVELGLPVRYVGVGEGVDDLRPFDPKMFVAALFENY